jgi:CRISPR-associated endonuclease/helicase Cas3
VTTNVQFFESLFANKSSRCRKLHNIANSVVIFDEAQMIPREYLQPCIRAISELVANYGCTAILCSATQPALQGLFPPQIKSTEICESIPELYGFFRRTTIVTAGERDDESLANEINAKKQALCIVNTKRHAQNLYLLLEREGSFHLSTLMTPAHRKRKLEEIRKRLKNGEPCRVISTSLIEAGRRR